MTSLKKQALSGIVWTAITQFSEQGIRFIVSIILARLLLPEEFGLIAMIAVFMGIGQSMIDSGMGSSLIRSESIDDRDLSTVFIFNILVALGVYAMIFLAAPIIADFYGKIELVNIIRVYCLSFIISSFAITQRSVLTRNMAFKKLTLVNVPALIISSTLGIYMAYNGYGVWSLVYSNLTLSFFQSLLLIVVVRWQPKFSFHKEKFWYHWNFGYKLLLSGILDRIFTNSYNIIIGKLYNPIQVGYYYRAESLKQLPVQNIGAILNKVTFPLFAKVQHDNHRLKEMYRKIMSIVVFIIAPVLFIAAAIAEPLFAFVLTEKWLPAVPYFQILCLNGILYPIHAYNLNVLTVKGRSDLFLRLEIIKKSLFVIVILISLQWGIYGLLWGSVVFSILAFFINTYYTGKMIQYGAFEQIREIVPYIIIALLIGFSVYFLDKIYLSNQHDLLRIIIGGLTGVLLYLSTCKLIAPMAIRYLLELLPKRFSSN